ncbi:MAG: insulinase family protein [Bacteroidetes bacterium]|nr:insulinase family protein [Bacteroidota bacterium]
MSVQYFTLNNGIRLIHKHNAREIAHCGVIINAGSRDEENRENGIAHFIEHIIFKGTTKRKAYHILSRLENIGAEFNAFTSKEETCIYASFLNPHYERSLELFSDILFNSIFPEKEIQKEKEVVLDEINSYKDSPAEQIFDDFEELLFNEHPIAHNILGKPELVKTFRKSDVQRFIANNYHTDQIVISSVGNIDFTKLIKLIEKYFGQIPPNHRKSQREKVITYHPEQKQVFRQNHLAHCIIGNLAYSAKDKKRLGLVLLNNILGGPGLNSRLNLALRERHGYTYDIESHYQSYSDTGVSSIYFGTDPENLNKSIDLVKKELSDLRKNKLGILQLSRAKQQIAGQLAISLESNLNVMLTNGKRLFQVERIESSKEIIDSINSLAAENLLEIANEIFNPNKLSTLIYNPNSND